MPLTIFKRRTLTGANVIGFGLGTVIFGIFFMLSLYMQQVLGFSAMQAGLGYLAVALTVVVASGISQGLVTKIGVKPVLVTGMSLVTAGMVYFTQVSPNGSYVSDLLPGFLILGVGMGFSFVPISIAALAGVQGPEAGLASGLINTSQQIGGALGLALLTTVATTHTTSLLEIGQATGGGTHLRLQLRLLGRSRSRPHLGDHDAGHAPPGGHARHRHRAGASSGRLSGNNGSGRRLAAAPSPG